MPEYTLALCQGQAPSFLTPGVPMGAVLSRKVVQLSEAAGTSSPSWTNNITTVAYINRHEGVLPPVTLAGM